jgi:hypothetical protein
MLNHINSNDGLINNNGLQESQGVLSVDKLKTAKNPYDKKLFLVDESEISQEALKLYEKDKEIEKYKSILRNQVSEQDANKRVASLVEQGIINISDDDLAASMIQDKNLLKDLF